MYIVELCTFIIPDVSNNVQTREMNKFFSKSWCVSWGRPSRWLKSESKTEVTMNKTLHRLGTFLSEASGGFSSAVLFVWLCGRLSVTSEWVCLQDQQQDYFCCTSAANQQWAAQDVCVCVWLQVDHWTQHSPETLVLSLLFLSPRCNTTLMK